MLSRGERSHSHRGGPDLQTFAPSLTLTHRMGSSCDTELGSGAPGHRCHTGRPRPGSARPDQRPKEDGRWLAGNACGQGVRHEEGRYLDCDIDHLAGASDLTGELGWGRPTPVSYTHLRAHETDSYLVCRLLLEKKTR